MFKPQEESTSPISQLPIGLHGNKSSELITLSEPSIVPIFIDESELENKTTSTDKLSQEVSQENPPIDNVVLRNKKRFLCSRCGKNFSTTFNLRRHKASCKLCPPDQRGPRFQCSCGRTYCQEFDLKRHQRKCKRSSPTDCKKCLHPDCKLFFYHRVQLVAHLKDDHNVDVPDPEELHFNNFEEFMKWKEDIEEKTYTYYSKQTGANVTGVSINSYYICQHDGSDRSHEPGGRKTERRNKKGRVKVGRFCWAQMNVKEFKDGTVKVIFHPTHTHPIDASNLEHHPLPNSISAEILRRLENLKKHEDLDIVARGRKRSMVGKWRMMKSLARKNRKLFRMATEETQTDVNEDNIDHFLMINEKGEVENTVSTDNVATTLTEPDCTNESVINTVEESRARCLILASHLSNLLAVDNLPEHTFNQIEQTLSLIIKQCQEQVVLAVDNLEAKNDARCAQDELTAFTEEESNTADNIAEKSNLKPVFVSPDGANVVLQNPMQIVQGPEFIILAWDPGNPLFPTMPQISS